MDRLQILDRSVGKWEIIRYSLLLISLASGLVLTVISWLHLCSEQCAEAHHYRLFNMPFEWIGVIFFISSILLCCLKKTKYLFPILSLAVGSEAMLIYSQQYIIGKFCPICLGIAAIIGIAFVLVLLKKGEFMKRYHSLFLVGLGFFLTFLGFGKFDELQATEQHIQQEITLGNSKSPLAIYVFSDWECPACRKVEPIITENASLLMEKAQLIFIDVAVHRESMNFTPYNLSFLIHNKPQYMKLRDALTSLAAQDQSPTEAQIESIANNLGLRYQQMDYADVNTATKYFETMTQKFGIEGTPTVVILNTQTKKSKKLVGGKQITKDALFNALESSTP